MTRRYEPVAPELIVPVTEGDAGLSVADARVQGGSAVLAFAVSMDRTRDVAVQVDYTTEDGSARGRRRLHGGHGHVDNRAGRARGHGGGACASGAARDGRAGR